MYVRSLFQYLCQHAQIRHLVWCSNTSIAGWPRQGMAPTVEGTPQPAVRKYLTPHIVIMSTRAGMCCLPCRKNLGSGATEALAGTS